MDKPSIVDKFLDSKMRYSIEEWIGNFLHNSIVHPLMPFLTKKAGERLHAWSIRIWDKLGHYDVL